VADHLTSHTVFLRGEDKGDKELGNRGGWVVDGDLLGPYPNVFEVKSVRVFRWHDVFARTEG
jgi:hypothetical protein